MALWLALPLQIPGLGRSHAERFSELVMGTSKKEKTYLAYGVT